MEAVKKLIKDLILAVVGFGIMYLLVTFGEPVGPGNLFGCFLGSGLIFGWRIAGRVIVGVSLIGICIKFILAVIIGIPAMPIVIISDIVAIIRGY